MAPDWVHGNPLKRINSTKAGHFIICAEHFIKRILHRMLPRESILSKLQGILLDIPGILPQYSEASHQHIPDQLEPDCLNS